MCETVGMSAAQAGEVLKLTELQGNTASRLEQLSTLLSGNAHGERGVARLTELFEACAAVGLPAGRVELDVSIARGLDYYTGTIYETFLNDLPQIGSVCSGGRYDNLAELFTRQQLPGIGASLGLDRLLAAMGELGMLAAAATPAPVLVTMFDAQSMSHYLRIARVLRAAGIATEVYCDARGLGKQLKYADRKGFRVAVIAGSDEFAAGSWQLKDLQAGSQTTVPEAELVATLRRMLDGNE
jgi:histidyl-tRNA synthetase